MVVKIVNRLCAYESSFKIYQLNSTQSIFIKVTVRYVSYLSVIATSLV